MKKTGIIIAAIVVVLLLAFGGVYLMKSSKAPVAVTQTAKTQTAKSQQTTNSLKGTIVGLLSGGKNVNCQVTYPDNKGTGSVYVSTDKKFAGDFTMKGTDGKETTAHMISDGTYMYIWSSGLPMGIKTSLEAAKNVEQNAQANQNVNINQEVGLNCSRWTPDTSKFTVPSDIQFRDMSNLLQQIPAQGTKAVAPSTQTGSSPCDQITNATAKAACVDALKNSGY
jgi:uncharacterized protein YpmB